MKCDVTNQKLSFELAIRTRGYQITLDVPERTFRLVKIEETPYWNISLRCKEGGCAT